MPRKTSRAAKKETAVDSKDEGVAPRRSGRSVTKPEPSPGKDASRSRRSSTAAQTAASVADSKSPKGRSTASARRESTSPSDSRTRGGREGLESPATRVKSTRRSTGRVNYKESDGEEEVPTPKYDENFDSGDEFDESESDEKSKPRGKSKPIRTAAKGRGSKEKAEGRTRGRRGRPSKKKVEDEEENKTFDVSDDSMELEVVATKEVNTSNKEKDVSKSRGRRQKAEIVEEKTDNKPKSSRRSVRSVSSKDESPKKRPSRSVQAKRYTEDEEDDIEDIKDDIEEEKEEKTETEVGRKRKRESSPEEINKRIKESESQQKNEIDKESEEVKEEVKESSIADEESTGDKTVEEPMELDECDSGIVSQDDSKAQEEEEMSNVIEDKKENVVEQKSETLSPSKEKTEESSEPVKEKLESMPVSGNTLDDKVEQVTSPEADDIKQSKEPEKEDTSDQKSQAEEVVKQSIIDIPSQSFNDAQSVDPTLEETKHLSPETQSEPEKISHSPKNIKESNNSEVRANDINVSQESKSVSEIPTILSTPAESNTIPTTNSNSDEVKPDHALNGTENINEVGSPVSVPQSSEVNVENKENSVSKENGSREDVHTNSTTLVDQYCLLPGRKYKVNSKLKEGVLQSVKGQTFGFLSYNLGSDMNVQKEKLLNEIHKLNSHIICLQQVPKPFYSAVLEPSLDALGYKSVFCQPEDSLKGMATFYKNSLFRLSSHSDVSLKRLIDKELETSSLDQASKTAIKTHIKRCGNVLFTHFGSVIGTQTITIVNVQIPPSDLSTHALQVSCLAREIIRINGGTSKPLLIGGEFNILENDASYQLLRDGYLSNDKIDELQRRKDIAVPEKENSSLVDLLWKSFQHPSSNLCSCYNSVLDHELFIPELKATSPDLVWYSSGSLHTIGVLDVGFDKLSDHHISLKADIAFVV